LQSHRRRRSTGCDAKKISRGKLWVRPRKAGIVRADHQEVRQGKRSFQLLPEQPGRTREKTGTGGSKSARNRQRGIGTGAQETRLSVIVRSDYFTLPAVHTTSCFSFPI